MLSFVLATLLTLISNTDCITRKLFIMTHIKIEMFIIEHYLYVPNYQYHVNIFSVIVNSQVHPRITEIHILNNMWTVLKLKSLIDVMKAVPGTL